MKKQSASFFISVFILTIFFEPILLPVYAQEVATVKEQVDNLQSAVNEKRSRVKELDALINGYRQRITAQESKQTNLTNEVGLIENQIEEKRLDIERSKTEADALNLEIASLEQQIILQEARMVKQKELIAGLVQRTHQADEVSTVDVLLTRPSLSSFFDRLEEISSIERDLGEVVKQVKGVRLVLQDTKKQRDERRADLLVEQKKLKIEERKLDEQRNMKASLIAETQQSQQEFERVLYELRQQQQGTADDIAQLQDKLKNTLDTVDRSLARGDVLLNWPVQPNKGISAHFHDPSYPFRRLFEHPGTDIPTPVGTPVRAVAGGYVAWNKTGKAYGNYTMIIHPGGIATVYAHLSKFLGKPDSYVERGDIIGLSGGRPGDPGAGLSTGAHLHFEVRQNGIPVNAENFLPHISGDGEG